MYDSINYFIKRTINNELIFFCIVRPGTVMYFGRDFIYIKNDIIITLKKNNAHVYIYTSVIYTAY